ncbi:Hypothetical predicted protein [Mytilus galloprovincialis]|nr:Hypothetical predicted protein [Mytilus galloprovincialis]
MLAVVMATILFVPLFYPLKMTSMYELIYTGIASFSPSTALQAVSGFPDWASFILIGVICTFYTFMGGLKTIVWVDVFQAFIMLSGILAIVIKATIEVGGIDHIWKLNDEWDRITFWNFDPDPTTRHTFWALVIGGMINWAGTYGASQASIQRFSSLPTLRDAKRAVLMNCVGVFLLLTLACLSGISVFAFYADKGCDPLSHGDIKNSNQIIPYFVSDMLGYPGVPGLFIACLFCGALSSLSSNLSSMVAVTWEDVMKPYFKDKSEENKAWITRILVIVYGALGIGTTFLFKNLKGTVLQASLSFMGAAGGALNGLIMLGAFFPWANWKGAVAGSLSSYVITMWVGIGKYTVVGIKENLPFPNSTCENSNLNNTDKSYSTMLPFNATDHTGEYFTVFGQTSSSDAALNELQVYNRNIRNLVSGLHQFYSLSYLWYSAFGMIIAFVVGLIVSFATGPTKPEDIDPKYMIPIFDRLFWCCLPNKILEFLHCGVDYDKEEIEDNEDIKTEATTIGSCSNMSALGSETFSYKF